MPDPHHAVDRCSQDKGHITAFGDLGEIGEEEGAIDDKKEGRDRAGSQHAPAPDLAHRNEEQRRRHQHRERNGNSVSRGQIVGFAKADGEPDGHGHQQPVDDADVNLTIALR